MSTILELAFAACQKLSVPQNIVLCHEINPNALWAEQKKINLRNGRKTKNRQIRFFCSIFKNSIIIFLSLAAFYISCNF